MKFSENGYYIEEYVKCDNCGVLIYNKPMIRLIEGRHHRYCSDWCIDWYMQRQADTEEERLGTDAQRDAVARHVEQRR